MERIYPYAVFVGKSDTYFTEMKYFDSMRFPQRYFSGTPIERVAVYWAIDSQHEAIARAKKFINLHCEYTKRLNNMMGETTDFSYKRQLRRYEQYSRSMKHIEYACDMLNINLSGL